MDNKALEMEIIYKRFSIFHTYLTNKYPNVLAYNMAKDIVDDAISKKELADVESSGPGVRFMAKGNGNGGH